jgi:signal transduction histidine kinase
MKHQIEQALGWLARPGIGRRIAIAMVLSLVAVQLQAFAQVWLMSDPQMRLVGTRWLAETASKAAQRVLTAVPEHRADLVAGLNEGRLVRYALSTEPPRPLIDDHAQRVSGQLEATLLTLTGAEVRRALVMTTRLRFHIPLETLQVRVLPDTLSGALGSAPLKPSDPEVLVPANLQVAMEGPDGTWLTVTPVAFETGGSGSLPWTALFVGGLIIAAVSTALARRIVAPLDRLVYAANRIGTSREFVPVPDEGLHEFGAVAQAFEDMQRRLLKFIEDRTLMLAAISHDLRSSLTRMRLLADNMTATDDRAQLCAEVDDMQAMLDSTLVFATGQARREPSRPTDIAAMLISLSDEANDRGHTCSYAGPDHAETFGNPVSLKRALQNLIDNAIKYGACARITLVSLPGWLRIGIEDDGPGIPPERAEEAFAPFRRLNAARTEAGAGLGMTIARDAILAHGGSIELGRAAAGAFCVTVTLPARNRSASPDHAAALRPL